MNNLQADITAQADGDSGAPKQQTAGIADAAVTGAKITKTHASSSFALGAGGSYAFPVGVYQIATASIATGITQVQVDIAGTLRTIHHSTNEFGGLFIVPSSGDLVITETNAAGGDGVNIYQDEY